MPAFQGSGGVGSTVDSSEIEDGSIVNADVNVSAGIVLSKLATDPLARANHTGNQLASTVSDFDTQVRTSRLDQMASPTSTLDLNAQALNNTNLQDFDRITIPADPSANHGRVYVKQIDASNDGIFIKIKKAGGFVEVQIA